MRDSSPLKTATISHPCGAMDTSMNDLLKKNLAAYETVREQLEAKHLGRTALIHQGEVVDIYNDSGDAYKVGCDNYGLGNFTIQVIGEPPNSLGIHTLCVPSSP